MVPGIAEKKNNVLPLWGNEKSMNLNNLILTNILSSQYFKVNLYKLKTYHEVIDEIYYKVSHLEPWEKGSRKTSGQTGMCGGVRGVGAGGIVSTAFCILYKLFTLKLTRKQVVGLINHSDSGYIRALGFMYIRYTQPPSDLWDWYEYYLTDTEEVDVKAGGGQVMSIGEMLRHFLSKLEWFSTLFPRIPVPIQKDLEQKLADWRVHCRDKSAVSAATNAEASESVGEKDYDSSNLQNSLNVDEHYNMAKNKVDVARERRRREKDEYSSSSHHRSLHYREYSSRSPVRNRDGDSRKHEKRHRNNEKDASSERRRHESNRYKFSEARRDFESRYSKDESSSHDRRKERRHEHSRSHDHSKGHDRHSRNRDY